MEAASSILIQAPREAVWKAITDIENAARRISAIEKVEVLERPSRGLVGFKWRETRTMMGKTATEVMWITDAEDARFYQTRAESHGSIYTSRLELAEKGGATELTMRFHGQPVKLASRILWGLLGFLFAGPMKKAMAKDLEDIKASVEGKAVPAAPSR